MTCEGTSDDLLGEAILIGIIEDQVNKVTGDGNFSLPPLPKMPPVTCALDQKLVKELAVSIRLIGDQLSQDPAFNHMIDGIALVNDKSCFEMLVKEVFNDHQINWGRIFVLFCSVGKLAAKMVLAKMLSVFYDIVNLSLEYFKRTLLEWICKKGGWLSSISELPQISIQRFSSTSPSHSIARPSAGWMLIFISGVLLGGVIVWNLKKAN